jgi:hypothetical protein
MRVGSQAAQGGVDIVRLIEFRAPADGDPGRLAQITSQRADDQYFHRIGLDVAARAPGVM